jgi:Zinc finger C-x8-C-x5-C-x3-H type (and similar)
MSVQSPFAQRCEPAEVNEDCRDYLRTGRCKYGMSCKYNHPANVQTGGGLKIPLDPSEPLFPLRPNEPVCQYYIKHGTCKFGQTCKFHHPPQSHLPNAEISGVALAGRKNEPQQPWNGVEHKTLLLPQRPDEPNCIFFLKNGRCKYGATCRYHHPLNYHDRRIAEDGRRKHSQTAEVGPKIHYITQLPPGSYHQGHFVVADGTVAFLTLDGSTPAHIIPVSQAPHAGEHPTFSGSRPLGHSRDVVASSSTPSIASSYETAISNMEMMGSHGESSSGLLWNRPRRNNSSNSLGAFNTLDGSGRHHMMQGGRTIYVQDTSTMHRVASASSNASEGGSVYYDAPQGLGRSSSSQQVQLNGNGTSWRGRRSNSFDQSGPVSLGFRDEEHQDGTYRPQHESQRSPMVRGRPPTGTRRRNQQGVEVDDGLSMMTSALLTMLDTPEEGNHEDYYEEQSVHSSQMSTPQMRPIDFALKDEQSSPGLSSRGRRFYHSGTYQADYYDHSTGADDRVLGLVMPHDSSRLSYASFESAENERLNKQGSFPWQGTYDTRSLRHNAQSLSVSQSGPTSPHSTSNVGLYLP